MMGDNTLKYSALFLIFVMFFASYGHIVFAQKINVGPPGSKEVETVHKSVGEKIESMFQKIQQIGKGIGQFVPFFKNTSQRIGSWWYLGAKPWVEIQWNNLNNYMEKEIRLE